MIDEIQVANLALIRDASLSPSRGLTAITGETGAGKTALLSALKLLMGARASADMVRDGEQALSVSGRFYNIGPVAQQGQGFSADNGEAELDDDVVVVRRVSADGRSRASINGAMASMHEVADLIAPAVDLCGQFEHQQLMKAANHVALLDAWAKDQVSEALREYRTAFANAREAASELARVAEASQLSSAKLEDARFTLKRIDEVSPREGEYEQLKHDLELAENAEALARAVEGAHEALSGDGGALDALGAAAGMLGQMGSVDESLARLADSLREVSYVVEDVSATTRDYRDRIEFDADTLAQQQERFSALQGLVRAYGPRIEDVFARREQAAEAISLVDDADVRLARAQQARDEAEQKLALAADALDAVRQAAAPQFAAQVSATMARLEMNGAELACAQHRLERDQWSASGPSAFEFLYRPGAGLQPRPFARIASGGEVSRVMLAIKVVLGAEDHVDTLVFDEVDTGVGGATAVALADVLADLATTHQVIVVTHLAQVAVKADTHYVVRRTGDETQLSLLDEDDRAAEIARMLSGEATDEALAHARALLGR